MIGKNKSLSEINARLFLVKYKDVRWMICIIRSFLLLWKNALKIWPTEKVNVLLSLANVCTSIEFQRAASHEIPLIWKKSDLGTEQVQP